MPTSSQPPGRLTDAQLAELLGLTKQADSVELKMTVPDSGRRAAVVALGMDPLDAQIRQVYFFDTPDLALNQQGVVVRARRSQGRPDDSVVKLRPVVPGQLEEAGSSKNLAVEVDAMPGGFVCSASMKASSGNDGRQGCRCGQAGDPEALLQGAAGVLRAHAPAGVELDDLSILGPITVLKLKFSPEGYAGRLVAELWFYPDGSRIFELFDQVRPAEGLPGRGRAEGLSGQRGAWTSPASSRRRPRRRSSTSPGA